MSEMPIPTRVFLMRHGAVVSEAHNHFNGRTDVGLNMKSGAAQAGRLADYLTGADIAAIYSSPLKRCRATIGPLAEKLDLSVTLVQDFQEMDFGVIDGLGFSQVREQYPDMMAAWFRDLANFRLQGGESMSMVQDRAWQALLGLVDAHPKQNIAVAAHGAVNRLVLARALKMNIQNVLKIGQDYACLNVLDFFPDEEVVVRGVNILPNPTWPGETTEAPAKGTGKFEE